VWVRSPALIDEWVSANHGLREAERGHEEPDQRAGVMRP
jgi:hypothetical protein